MFPNPTAPPAAAKIYRIGIMTYGKKPSWKTIFKWLREK